MRIFITALVIAFLFGNIYSANSASIEPIHPWKTWKKSKNLSVSSRVSTIDNLTEIKATALVNSSLSGFLLFIEDVNNTPNWLTNANHSEVISQLSATESIFIVTFSAIWPLKARHLQLHSTYWQNNDLSVEIQLQDDFSIDMAHSDAVRIKFYNGHWLLTPVINNNIKQLNIEYTFIANSGGDMPKWFEEQLALKSILKSMKKLSQQLPKSKWQQQTISGITEISL